VVTVEADQVGVESRLAAGRVDCPDCRGPLRPGGRVHGGCMGSAGCCVRGGPAVAGVGSRTCCCRSRCCSGGGTRLR